MPSAEGCSFSIRIAGRGSRYPSRKTSVLVPEGKPRTFKVRGFSLIHAPDTEAHTDGRAFLFAEYHTAESKGGNPRQTTSTGPRVGPQSVRERVLRVDGSAPEASSESEGIAFESGRWSGGF